jgi:hypothetical protein
MGIPEQINQRLPAQSAFTIDTNFSIIQSAEIIQNPRPEWRIFPIVPEDQSAGDGGITKMIVTFSVTTTGTVYAQVI